MITTNATVFIVDDDAAMRDSLGDLIRSVGLRVELFDSAQDFLRSERLVRMADRLGSLITKS